MMDDALRAFVRERAGGRCEYCRLHQHEYEYQTFHVEHIIAKQHGGTDDPETLCLACSECNWAKGPNLAGLLDGNLYPLFNPRKQNWNRHFRWEQTTPGGQDQDRHRHRASAEHEQCLASDATGESAV
jgi:HNH endonuclease